jgi:hypothetical protein
MTQTRRIIAQGPTPRLFALFATIAIFIALLAAIQHRPLSSTEREADGVIGEDALRRAQVLYQQLAFGAPPPPMRVTYSSVVSPVHPEEEVVVSSAEPEITGWFLVIYDMKTPGLRRLVWAGTTRSAEPAKAQGQQELLDHDRAVLVARRCLRVAGINVTESNWTARKVHRVVSSTPDGVRFVWQVILDSPHWLFQIALDAVTGAPTQILLLPRNNEETPITNYGRSLRFGVGAGEPDGTGVGGGGGAGDGTLSARCVLMRPSILLRSCGSVSGLAS